MSILREIFVHLGLATDVASFAEGALAAKSVEEAVGKIVDAAKMVATTFVENIKATAEYDAHILKLGATTGLGTKSLQQLGRAAAEEGIGIDEFAGSMLALTRRMYAAEAGSKRIKKAFQDAGVSTQDLKGPAEGVLAKMASQFEKMPDGAKKAAVAAKLGVSNLIEMLDDGRAHLEESFKTPVMSEEQLRAGKEAVKIQGQLERQTTQLWRSAIAPLMPAIRDLLKQFYEWKKANAEVIKQNITKFISTGITVIRGLGAAFVVATKVVKLWVDQLKAVGFAVGLLHDNVLRAVEVFWELTDALGITDSVVKGLGVALTALKVIAATFAASIALSLAVAFAPLIAVGAVLAGLFVLFDDLRHFMKSVEHGGKGANTLFGQFNAQIEEWANRPGPKPWWLIALQTAQTLLLKLLGLSEKWQDSMSGTSSVKPEQSRGIVQRVKDFAVSKMGDLAQSAGLAGPAEFDRLVGTHLSGAPQTPESPNFTPYTPSLPVSSQSSQSNTVYNVQTEVNLTGTNLTKDEAHAIAKSAVRDALDECHEEAAAASGHPE